MNNLETTARVFVAIGIIILIIGVVLLVGSKLGLGGFRLPGDIFIKRGNFTFYFPWVTCIVLSIILSIIFNIFGRK